MRFAVFIPFALLLAGCASRPDDTDALNTRAVRLPGGQEIRAEVMTNPADMARGMMFRESLAPDRGMLFVHGRPGLYTYWMYQVKIPLDIVWLDGEHRIVEISADTPPCKTEAAQCPSYGGHAPSEFVVELAGGMAARYGLNRGARLEF